jgi:hypothetical protein
VKCKSVDDRLSRLRSLKAERDSGKIPNLDRELQLAEACVDASKALNEGQYARAREILDAAGGV